MTILMVVIAYLRVVVRMHYAPHADEWAALRAIMKYARNRPEWIEEHCPLVTSASEPTYLLELGTGLGEFNEHEVASPDGTVIKPRVEGECCYSLVLRALGLIDHPYFARILAIIKAQDLEGKGDRHDLGVFIKTWAMVRKYRGQGNHAAEVGRWVFESLDLMDFAEALHQSGAKLTPGLARAIAAPQRLASLRLLARRYFWQDPAKAKQWAHVVADVRAASKVMMKAAKDEIRRKERRVVVKVGDRTLTGCVVTTKNPSVQRAYRAKGMPRRDFLVCFTLLTDDPEGPCQVMVAATERSGLKLDEVVFVLRAQLWRALSVDPKRAGLEPPLDKFRTEGFTPHLGLIYYAPGRKVSTDRPASPGFILNGALTAPDVPPLVGPDCPLTKQSVIDAVVEGIRRSLVNASTAS